MKKYFLAAAVFLTSCFSVSVALGGVTSRGLLKKVDSSCVVFTNSGYTLGCSGNEINEIFAGNISVSGSVSTSISLPDGTEALPSLAFINNTDLGFFRVGADTIGVSSAGSQVMNISSAGVGIDAGGLNMNTQIISGGSNSGDDLTLESTTNATKGSLFFGTSEYDEVNNRLGVATTSPANTLDVNGGIDADTLNTGSGDYKLFAMDQDVQTSNAVSFLTLNTGQGDNELYVMDQDVQQADSPTFAGATLSNLTTGSGIVTTNTSGVLSSSTALPDETTAITQSPGDNSTDVATTAYVDAATTAEDFWDRITGTPNYVIPNTAADDIGATGARITKGWFTDLEVTNSIAGDITGNAATVTTITGLAPDTATTQATQANITSASTLATVGTITTGVWNAGAVTSSGAVQGTTGLFTDANSLTLGTASAAAGGIIYQNATNANTVTIQSGVTSGTYTNTWPPAVAGAGGVLTDVAGNGVLSWGAAGGVAWNDTRTNGTGIGLAHTIGATAASGVQSIVTTVDNTQSNTLTVNEIDLGTSALAHIGLKITASGASTSQEGISMIKGLGSGVKITDTNTTADSSRGAFQYASTSGGGTAFLDITGATNTQNHQSLNFNVSANQLSAARTSPLCEILSDRGSAVGATASDNYDAFSITRRTNEGPLGTFNAAGSILFLENIYFSTTGNDTVALLELKQDTDSTGDIINAVNGAIEVFVIEDNGALNPQTADPCATRDAGYLFYNSTSNYFCFCDGAGDDIKMNDNTTACF